MLTVLLQRVQRGDDAAFGELYGLTRPTVARVVLATVRAPEHADEVVQEVYLHVWQHAWTFDEARGSVLAWLTTIARHRAVDRVRHVVRAADRDRRDAWASAVSTADVEEIGLARHEAAQLRRALERLPVRQRDAVSLTFLHGYSHEQAAQLLSLPLGTLKTRVRSGVLSLRQHLAPGP